MAKPNWKRLRNDPAARERTCVYCVETYGSAAEATACEQGHEANENSGVLGYRATEYGKKIRGERG